MGNVNEIKDMASFLVALIIAVDRIFEDGRFTGADLLFLMSPMAAAEPAFDNLPTLKDEFKNLDDDGRAEILGFISAQLQMTNEVAEYVTEKAIDAGLDIYLAVKAIKNKAVPGDETPVVPA